MISDYFLSFLTMTLHSDTSHSVTTRQTLLSESLVVAILCSPSCCSADFYALPSLLKRTDDDHMLVSKSAAQWDAGRTPKQPVLSSIYVWLSSLGALGRDPYVALAASHLRLLRRCSTASFCVIVGTSLVWGSGGETLTDCFEILKELGPMR